MRIEKLNDNKLKIMFNSKELEENNITVHSFLSGSNEAQKLFLAILDIADEEFGFNIKNCNISSETISFENKNFIIFITKKASLNTMDSEKNNKISPYNLLDFTDYNHTKSTNFLGFLPPLNSENNLENIIYKFETIEEVLSFCKYVNLELPESNLDNSLYKYNDSFFIIIHIKKLSTTKKQQIISILSDYKDYIYLSPLAHAKLIEHSNLILEDKAIQSL